nr:acyltransferase family protein [Brucella anthropi]
MPNIISRNTTADVLRGFGIIAVVAGHAGSNIGIQVLPVYSYHMPLFFFISGMFYNDVRREKFLDIITKLCTRLVVPALISILIYNFIVLGIFHKFGLPIQSQEFGIASIIRSFTFGTLFAAACWFISTYIAVYVYFAVVNRAIFTKIVGISNGELKRVAFIRPHTQQP